MHWEGLHLLSRAMCLGYTIFFFLKETQLLKETCLKTSLPCPPDPEL